MQLVHLRPTTLIFMIAEIESLMYSEAELIKALGVVEN